MSRYTDIFSAPGPVNAGDPAARAGLGLGLASRLPRWRSFDGLHSRIAPSWAGPHDPYDRPAPQTSPRRPR